MSYTLMMKIEEAFGVSTRNYNRFAEVLKSVKWDYEFYADNEYYFVKGNMTFTTPSLNPFEVPHSWPLYFMFADGSMIELRKSF